jgi:hypothetical protein
MEKHKFGMNEKIFIIAGNYNEYKDWVQKNMARLYSENNSISLSNFVYVDSIDRLRGRKEVHGFFIGSFENREDFKKIKAYIEVVNSLNKTIKDNFANPDDVKDVVKKINGGSLLSDNAAPYTIFNQTRLCPIVVYHQNKIIDSKTWDEELWVERGEDYYGLMSSQLVNKKVRVINREEWLKSPVIVKDINYVDRSLKIC